MVYRYVFCVVSAVRNFSLGLLQAKQVNCIPFRQRR